MYGLPVMNAAKLAASSLLSAMAVFSMVTGSMAINRRAAQLSRETTVPQQPSHCLRVQQVRVSFAYRSAQH